jgi:ATP-dependent RNA helicase DDX23/PRP28
MGIAEIMTIARGIRKFFRNAQHRSKQTRGLIRLIVVLVFEYSLMTSARNFCRRYERDRGDTRRRHDYNDRRSSHTDRRARSPPRRPNQPAPDSAYADRDHAAVENGTNTNNHRVPLPLEELVRRRQAEAAEAAKPVFLTKAQRAELALQKRQAGASAQRAATDAVRQGLAVAAGRGAVVQPSSKATAASLAMGGSIDARQAAEVDRARQRELQAIKQHYLGEQQTKKKRSVNAGERFRFNFDWDASEDTSRDANPLYKDVQQQDAMLLFGRGFRAGMDRREQKRVAVEVEAGAIARAAKGANVHEEEEAKPRREDTSKRIRLSDRAARADRYDGRDMRVDAHWSEKPREAMTERDWRIFREDFSISYKGSVAGAMLPIRNWDEANLPESVRRGVERAGYKAPSPIQMAALPLGLVQRDVIGIAETGSGKTAAFVLPMLAYILKQPRMAGHPEVEAEGPYAVVLAPTRELAQQIEEEARALAHYTGFRVVSVVGGQSIEDQGVALRKGCEIVVATPGRLKDCVEQRYAVLNQCNYVVLDEADRMIDMGFEPQVMAVLDAMPSSNLKPENEDEPLEENRVYRTTYMFSATMPPAVERLARKYLRRPIVVQIGTAGKATDNITQRVAVMKENEKNSALSRELGMAGDGARVIVFANTQKKCEQVARYVEGLGYALAMLHGGKTQDQREEAIRGFRDERYTVLVATDVAGRGIDVPNVALVVNYDMPNTIEAYTHRIGRTGRAGRKGNATTFLTMQDADVFFDLKKFLEESGASIPRELASHEAARQKPGARDTRALI